MQPEPTPDELALAPRIAMLAQDPSGAARARIMAAVRSAPMPATASPRRAAAGGRWRLALVGFGTAGLLVVASVGALAASSDALPNSPAYKLRLFEESLRVAVADPRQQSRLHLQFAAEKVRQAKEQIRLGDATVAAELLSDTRHDLSQAETELQATNDAAEELNLEVEHDSLQSETVIAQAEVNTIVNSGGAGSPAPDSSPPPSDSSGVPAPPSTAVPPREPAPAPAPDTSPTPSPDSAPAAPVEATPTPY
jgi:hypothetical protein